MTSTEPHSPAIGRRPVEPQDTDFLARVYASTRAEELAPVPWSDEQKMTFCRMQSDAQATHYAEHYPVPPASHEIITDGGVPAGRLYVHRGPTDHRIVDITLLPEHRGAGIGRRLLEQLQAEAAAAGKSLSIHVERFNRALQLYERLGFRVLEDKGVYLLMEWRASA